jgi:transcriptional regulator with XRE-family HTH domain
MGRKQLRERVELSAAIQRAMKNKKLTPKELGEELGVNAIMVEKIICGDVVPSSHLEKQMIEVLEITPDRIKGIAQRRQKRVNPATKRDSRRRTAA